MLSRNRVFLRQITKGDKEEAVTEIGRGKSDDLSDRRIFKGLRLGNFKGKKKGWQHTVLRKAYGIVHYENLKEWEKEFGISKADCKRLRYMMIRYRQRREAFGADVASTDIPKTYPPKALQKMAREVDTLMTALVIFGSAVQKAQEEGNANLLNTVRKVFGDDAPRFLSMLSIDAKKIGRADNIRPESISRACTYFKEWLGGEDTANLPGSLLRISP